MVVLHLGGMASVQTVNQFVNAGHSAIGYLGALAGFKTIHEIVQNSIMAKFLTLFLEDAAVTVPAPAGVNLKEYQHTLVERFSNPTLSDQTLRICKDGSAKVPGFLLPSLLELLNSSVISDKLTSNNTTKSFALVLAAWYVFVGTELKAGRVLDDAAAQQVTELYKRANSARAFYQDQSLFGDLCQQAEFLARVEEFVLQLESKAALEVVEAFHR